MTYQVLARRWRPQRFEDLIGQDVVVRTLRNAITSGQIGHAYMFSGLRGVGKTTVARLLAKALNCESGPTPDPCGTCVPCREIVAGSSLDVLEIDAASNRGIDDVRELREVARILPVRDRYRVFILDEAHQLSKDAFGALLKILEEPPPHVVFVLASTEKDRFPATILSRCQQLDFRPIPAELIAGQLTSVADTERIPLTAAAGQQIARAAAGSLRDALSLLDRVRAFGGERVDENTVAEVLGLPATEVLLALWRTLAGGSVGEALEILRGEERAGHDPMALYEQLIQLLHTLLLLSCDAKVPIAFAESERVALVADATRMGSPLLLRLLALALEQRSLVATADETGLAVAVAVGRLTLWPRLLRVEELLAGTAAMPGAPAGISAAEIPPGEHRETATKAGTAASPVDRLVEALHDGGSPTLAARLRTAASIEVEDDTLVVRFANVSEAAIQSVRDGLPLLAKAARQAGLATGVRVEEAEGGRSSGGQGPTLRERVEGDERVKKVVEVFGGRIEKVEEQP